MTPSQRLFDAIGAQLILHQRFGDVAPRVGEEYEIVEILGAGGFGLICAATQLSLRRPVALKLFPLTEPEVGESGVREALREARSLARLEHPNIVVVYAAGESELIAGERLPCAFVEMQRIDGVDLRAWLRAQPRPAAEVLDVLLAAGQGLAHAHAAGMLHRDFKPENLMVDRQGRARIIDFGLALVAELDGDAVADPALARWRPGADAIGTRATGTGLIRGTPGYMAPELTQGRPRAASDQFAFAIVVREALTGRHPFAELDDAPVAPELEEPELEGPEFDPSAGLGEHGHTGVPIGGPALFARLEPALDRAMATLPSARFPSVAELCEVLAAAGRGSALAGEPDAIAEAEASRGSGPSASASLGPARAPRRWPALLAGVGLLASVGLGAWWLRGSAPRVPDSSAAAARALEPTSSSGADSDAPSPDPSAPAETQSNDPSPSEPTSPDEPAGPAEPASLAGPTGPSSCADLEAWAGTWQATTKVTWTEYAYQLDWRVDYELELALGERCSVTVTARKYPPMIEGELPGSPIETTAEAVALREASGIWRVPLRLSFADDTRTYAAAESYETVLILDRHRAGADGRAAAPRLRGAFRKLNEDGRWIRLGLLAGERGVAPDPRSIGVDPLDPLACAARCRIACAGATAEASCYARGCASLDAEAESPVADQLGDRCGPPSYDFRAPMRAIAARESLRAGHNPFTQALERGNRAKQLADCAANATALTGAWGLWLGERALALELRSDACELAGTLRDPGDPEAAPVAVAGYVTAAGTWVLQPQPADGAAGQLGGLAATLPEALVLVGVGERGPAFGTDTGEPATLLRAYRPEPR